MKAPYHCLYNHELLILGTSQTPYCSYREPVSDAQAIGYVQELKGTGVDALMICPQAWMTNLWVSEVDRRWQDEAPLQLDPMPDSDRRYFDKAYHRIKHYMLGGADPVGLSVRTARESGISPFFSYRMNEAHYTRSEECPTHSMFWRNHPEYRVEGRLNLDYLEPEVREYFQALIFELLDRYDVDGFECDFMRHPSYFRTDRIAEGTAVMTEFVRSIRAKLDEIGRRRGRKMWLSVRVPRSPDDAKSIGLDVPAWIEQGLVDMIVASSFFQLTTEIDIEGYRAMAPDSSLFGEMHFNAGSSVGPAGYRNNITRKTPPSLYRSAALAFLERGADGVSLFNFAYVRDHSFNEPRRKIFPGIEPPFSVIPSLKYPEELASGSQHIVFMPGSIPLRDDFCEDFSLYFPGDFDRPFSSVIIRLEASDTITHIPGISVRLNGALLGEIPVQGELFPPLSVEGLPDFLKVRHFAAEAAALRHGANIVTLEIAAPGYNWGHWGGLTLTRLEAALYR